MPFENKKTEFKVKYFNLKDDGDEAIVRFAYSDPSEFEAVTVHTVKDTNFYRKVACIDSPEVPCPFCDNGVQIGTRFFVRLISYITDEAGNIVPQACIWDRPASFGKTLKSFIDEYGDLKRLIFKVRRSGARGDMSTTYSIIPANTQVYKDELYVPDFSDFNDFTLKNKFYFEKSFSDMTTYLATGQFPVPRYNNNYNNQYVRGSARSAQQIFNESPVEKPQIFTPNAAQHINYEETCDASPTPQVPTPQQVIQPQTPQNTAARPRRYSF